MTNEMDKFMNAIFRYIFFAIFFSQRTYMLKIMQLPMRL